MILKVNPTRINLLNLKKELKLAVRGHKLLKDKRDGLMRQFMGAVREAAALREKTETHLGRLFALYRMTRATVGGRAMDGALMLPAADISLGVKMDTVMSVPIPRLSLEKSKSFFSYGFLDTESGLDASLQMLDALFPDLIRLAELEKAIENLAFEIERTRRRASALENTRIPNLKDTIRFITMRLEEQARDAIVGTMRIKAQIMAKG